LDFEICRQSQGDDCQYSMNMLRHGVCMKTNIILFIFFLNSIYLCANLVTNQPFEQLQPNGVKLQLFVSGDEYYHRVHDANDYTIVIHPETGYAVYAIPDGNSIKASDYVVGKVNPVSLGIQPKLMKKSEEADTRYRSQEQYASNPNRTPTTGSFNNIVCFVRFHDQTEYPASPTYFEFGDLFNSTTQQSLKTYYQEVSSNQLDISTYLYPGYNPNGWVTSIQLPYNRGYYSPFNAQTNPGGYINEQDATDREYVMMVYLISMLDAYVPDNIDVDSDNDNSADGITFVFRGSTDAWGDLLWPSHVTWQTVLGYVNGASVYHYIKDFEGGLGASVICHEAGHNIGFPDLYHYTDNGINPVGAWDLMAADNTQHELTYMKWKYGHWFSTIPTITPTSSSVQYTLTAIDRNPYSCYKIASNITGQYYMLEYRRQAGMFDIGVPSTGLIIYRVTDYYFPGSINGNSDGPPDEVYVYRPGGNNNTDGDIPSASFSANAGRIEFNNNTDPEPWMYVYPGTSVDGNLVICDVGVSGGNTITFRVRNSILPTFVWDGSTSQDWWVASNWSQNTVPSNDSDVEIPYGVPNYPKSESVRAVHDLHVESGAFITFGSGTFQVRGDFENEGTLIMDNINSNLVVEGDMFFRTGASASITNSGALMVMHGSMQFDIGSNVHMTQGTIQFENAGNAYIVVNASSSIGKLLSDKTLPDRLYIISSNTSDLTINKDLEITGSTNLTITAPGTVIIKGNFVNPSGNFTCTAGTVSFQGIISSSIVNHLITTSYFNNLDIAKTGSASISLGTALEVMGNLTIQTNSALANAGYEIIIHGDLTSYGHLSLTGSGDIYVYDDVSWEDGSTASAESNNTTFQVVGDMTFKFGSDIDLSYGIFYFYANGNSTVYVYENAHICVIASFKESPYSLSIDGYNTASLYISMGIQVDSSKIMKIVGPINVYFSGTLIVNGLLQCDAGAIIYQGNANCNLTCSSAGGSYFNNLTVNLQSSHTLYLLTSILIKGDLSIIAGVLNPNNNAIEFQGDWNNDVSEPGFIEGTGQVTASGSSNQLCFGEHFNTLILNKSGGELIFPYNTFSRCVSYDWTAGAIRIDGGYLIADDLADNGVYGTITVASGNLEMFQDASSYIDFNANILIQSGTFKIIGGSAASRWANSVNAGITMTGGVLDFVDNGITIRSSAYTITLSLNGGMIRTNRNLTLSRSSITISTGTFEMYGPSDATVSFGTGTGSSLPNLIINKAAKGGGSSGNDPVSRPNGSEIGTNPLRANLVTSSTNLTLNGSLSITSGTFYLYGKTITVAGSVTVGGTLQMTLYSGSYGSIVCGGDFIWNNGSVSNIAGGTIQYGGNWRFYSGSNAVLTSCPVTFTGSANAQITSSSSTANFGNLTFSGTPNGTSHVDVAMAYESTQPLLISGLLAINTGNYLYLGGKTLIVSDNVTLTGTASLYVDADAVLQMASAKILTVNSGCTLHVQGCNGHNAKITHQSGYYVVNIESGGTISARYGLFEYMGTSGINVKTGALVDTSYPFNYCTFQNGAASGSLLTVNNSQTITVYGAIFPTNTWSGSYNVSKSSVTGTVTFINATGGFSGESYDGDLLFHIFWTSDTYELVILSTSPNNSSLYVCDPITYSAMIYNSSTSNITVPVRVDIYYNRSTAPTPGLAGDQSVVISSLNAQSLVTLPFQPTSCTATGSWHIWFQVDPFNEITESNEGNNTNGDLTTAWNALPSVPTPSITINSETQQLELNWTYPITANHYLIYRSDNASGPFTAVGTSTSKIYTETLTGPRFFYKVTAERYWP
jgi:M6 family metalloprotease-like protein